MRYEICIDNLIITADVHAYETSNWYKEIDYTIERVLELDEDDIPYALSNKEIDAILCGLENVVKTKLMLEIERENEE
nr:MAG TPA: hypothetical protein [Caudoviricetes sp.]